MYQEGESNSLSNLKGEKTLLPNGLAISNPRLYEVSSRYSAFPWRSYSHHETFPSDI